MIRTYALADSGLVPYSGRRRALTSLKILEQATLLRQRQEHEREHISGNAQDDLAHPSEANHVKGYTDHKGDKRKHQRQSRQKE